MLNLKITQEQFNILTQIVKDYSGVNKIFIINKETSSIQVNCSLASQGIIEDIVEILKDETYQFEIEDYTSLNFLNKVLTSMIQNNQMPIKLKVQ